MTEKDTTRPERPGFEGKAMKPGATILEGIDGVLGELLSALNADIHQVSGSLENATKKLIGVRAEVLLDEEKKRREMYPTHIAGNTITNDSLDVHMVGGTG